MLPTPQDGQRLVVAAIPMIAPHLDAIDGVKAGLVTTTQDRNPGLAVPHSLLTVRWLSPFHGQDAVGDAAGEVSAAVKPVVDGTNEAASAAFEATENLTGELTKPIAEGSIGLGGVRGCV